MPLLPDLDTFATNRLITYLGISFLTALSTQLKLVANGDFVIDSPVKLAIVVVEVVLPPAIVLRAFMDQSLSKKDE